MSAERRDEVLGWMAETGRGYRAAEKQFGIPRATIQSWAQAERAGKAVKPRARARTTTETSAPKPEPDWDPVSCTREEYLDAGIRRCLGAARTAQSQGHGGVARQWEVTAASYRDELDALREEERRKAEARGREGHVDPDQLCRRLLRQLPALVRLAPEVADEVYRELERLLGQREVG